jgi:DNA-binding FrmR family transcriptional regulator
MSDEDKAGAVDSGNEGSGDAQKDTTKQETVEYSKYIGVKEMLTKEEAKHKETQAALEKLRTEAGSASAKVTEYETKVQDLEGQITQLKNSVGDPEELKKVKDQLASVEGKLLEAKRTEISKLYGIETDKVANLGEAQLEMFEAGLKAAGVTAKSETSKPQTDMGEGEGGRPASAKAKINAGFAALHPEK